MHYVKNNVNKMTHIRLTYNIIYIRIITIIINIYKDIKIYLPLSSVCCGAGVQEWDDKLTLIAIRIYDILCVKCINYKLSYAKMWKTSYFEKIFIYMNLIENKIYIWKLHILA